MLSVLPEANPDRSEVRRLADERVLPVTDETATELSGGNTVRSMRQVRAALEYYSEFAHEVDGDSAVADRVARDERNRWERQQRALA